MRKSIITSRCLSNDGFIQIKVKIYQMIIIVICLPLFQFLMSIENDKAIMQFVF